MKKSSQTPIFRDRIKAYPAQTIAQVIGCKPATAYDWLKGRRKPTRYAQQSIVEKLEKEAKAAR